MTLNGAVSPPAVSPPAVSPPAVTPAGHAPLFTPAWSPWPAGSLLIVIDTETTGLPKDPDVRPIQVGAVAFDTQYGKEIAEFRLLLNPDVWASDYKEAQKVHGISKQRCAKHGAGMSAGWDKFMSWVQTLCTAGPWRHGSHRLAAWNSAFDREMLARWRAAAKGRGTEPELPVWPEFSVHGAAAPNGCIQAAWRGWLAQQGREVPRHGALKAALACFALPPQPEPHDAVTDARMAGHVWWAMESRHRRLTRA